MGKRFYYFGKCLFTLGRPFYRTKVIGKENIIKKEPCIYASNHLSAVDIPLIQVHVPGYRRYIGKKEFGKKKFSEKLLKNFGVIFMDREKPELSTLREVFKQLETGQIVIFPEGTRNKGDEKKMLEIKQGLALFASKSGVPVIPIVLWKRPRFMRKNYMYIGKPLDICETKGRMPGAEQTALLTALYQYEFEKCRVILDDYVANKRWRKKRRLKEGEKSQALLDWEAANARPTMETVLKKIEEKAKAEALLAEKKLQENSATATETDNDTKEETVGKND